MIQMFSAICIYTKTLWYLKPKQIWFRILRKVFRPKPDLTIAPSVRLLTGQWEFPIPKNVSLQAPTRFRFLNKEHEIVEASDWNSDKLPKLWLYNLHYFDDLNAVQSSNRKKWHIKLVARWIIENPPGVGIGWEPYPLSIRIVNWIKFALAGFLPSNAMLHSLAVQIRFLSNDLEWHLLGNHLLANAKALVFGGCYFSGDEARSWIQIGMRILEEQIPEQILPDGGHFERSTMYHAIITEDLLDLLNLVNIYPDVFSPWKSVIHSWSTIISNMVFWMQAMSHSDGEIAFFNDAAVGIAPPPPLLLLYAERLRISVPPIQDNIIHLNDSGYIRVNVGDGILFIDVAKVGPDYLPGHAHADTLSYEFSLSGKRVVVNSGTSRYELGSEREWERSTAAHNTVEIDGQNSSEVWAGFRVAGRASPFDVRVDRQTHRVIIEAAHDGYRRLPGGVIHRRCWIMDANSLEVRDTIEGQFTEAISRVYLHPDSKIEGVGPSGLIKNPNRAIRWRTTVPNTCIEGTMWHPEFGVSVANKCIKMVMQSYGKITNGTFTLTWN